MLTSRLRGPLRKVSGLAAGTAVSGVLAYVFFALVTRALGSEAAAPVSVLWAWWSFTGAGLTFPLQHWIARTVAAERTEAGVRLALSRVLWLILAVGLSTAIAATAAREVLFRDGGLAFPALSALVVVGSALMGLVRGLLTARRRFSAVGVGLVAENAVRCLGALALILADVDDPAAYGGCLVLGYLAAFGFPTALRPYAGNGAAGSANPFGFLGGAGTGQLVAQAVLTGGPVLLAAAGGAPTEVTALFAGLALFRAPYTVGVGVLAPVTERVTRLVIESRRTELDRLRGAVAGATGVALLAGAPLAWWLGPRLIRLVFGDGVRLPAAVTTLVAVGTVLAMTNLLLTVLLMARDRTGALTRGWLVALVPGAAWFALADLGLLPRTAWTFVVVEAVALLWLATEELLAERAR